MNAMFPIFSNWTLTQKPVFRLPAFNKDDNSSPSRMHMHSHLLTSSVKRRFPKTSKAGESQPCPRRQWINPLSKLEELYKGGKESRQLLKNMTICFQPSSSWKPLVAGIKALPLNLSSA